MWCIIQFEKEHTTQTLEGLRAGTKITIKTINLGYKHLSAAVDGLENASNNKSTKDQLIKLPKSCTTSDLPIDANEVATKEKLRK